MAAARREPLILVLAGVAALGYAVYAVWEHNHFMTDLDLAVRDQALWHYSNLESARITTLGEPINALGDHFSPINISLTPLYWAWSDPRMLLIAQALLIAASAVPVFLFARPRLGRVGAYLLCGGYLTFWGLNGAVAYQFHDLAFAPLLIGLCVLFADRGRWTGFFTSLAALLLVQENMPVLAAFIGLWLITGGEVRRGAATVAIGIASFFLVVEVLMPAFAGDAGFRQWSYESLGADAPSAAGHLATHPQLLLTEFVDDPTKRSTLAFLLAPFLALVLCSRLALLCIPLLAQQLFSDRTEFWGREFHYWLTIAPILAMGAADGFSNLLGWLRRERSRALAGGLVGAVILCANLIIAANERWLGSAHDIQVSGIPALGSVQHGSSLSPGAEEHARRRAIDSIPADASVTATAHLLPHLSRRDEIHLLGYPAPPTEYVVFSPNALPFPDPAYAQGWLDRHRSRYRPVFNEDGWAVWRRLDLSASGPGAR